MEIQQGKGPWASPVNGIVPLGTTLTMVVGIDDKEGRIIEKILFVVAIPKRQSLICIECLQMCDKKTHISNIISTLILLLPTISHCLKTS